MEPGTVDLNKQPVETSTGPMLGPANDTAASLEPTEKRKPKAPSTMGETLKSLAAYSFLFGIFALGFGIGQSFWSSSFSSLQLDLRHSQDELTKTRAELDKVKLDSAKAFGQIRPDNPSDQLVVPLTESSTTTKNDAKQADVKLESGTSTKLFKGALTISLIGLEFKTDPSRYVATASVSSPGQEVMRIRNAEIGYTAKYLETNGFEIQILSVNAFSARFLVKRD